MFREKCKRFEGNNRRAYVMEGGGVLIKKKGEFEVLTLDIVLVDDF